MPKKLKKIWLVVLFFACLFLLSFFASNQIKDFYHRLFKPFESFIWQKSDTSFGFFNCLFNYQKIKTENENLKKENVALLTKINLFQNLTEESLALKKLNTLEEEKEIKLVLSRLISRGIENDTLLINQGAKNGLKPGLAALSQNGSLLGILSSVENNFSKIELITAKKQTFDIAIKGENNTLALAQGKGNLNLDFQFAPKEDVLNEGDLAFTSILGGKFPNNILIGSIKNIQKNEAEKFQQGEIKPYFLETNFNFIFIVLDENS